jgi:AbrB family looped-hinge helix DNA binding protein
LIDEVFMETVLVSPKFQVVIPKSVRGPLGLTAGMRIQVLRYGDRIELVPLRKAKTMRGFLKGIDTKVVREEDRV